MPCIDRWHRKSDSASAVPGGELDDLHDQFVEALQSNIPQDWESSEGSAESIVLDYVREIERRLIALGGFLERHPQDGDAGVDNDASSLRTFTSPQAPDDLWYVRSAHGTLWHRWRGGAASDMWEADGHADRMTWLELLCADAPLVEVDW